MKSIFHKIIEYKYLSLISLILVAFFSSINGLDRFRFDASSETLVLDEDPSYEFYEEINNTFSSSEYLVLAISDQNIFSNEFFLQIQELENSINNLEEVESVISILDAPLFEQPKLSLIKSATNDKYILQDELDLQSVKNELIKSPLFTELVVNENGTATAMQINLKQLPDYEEAVKKIREIMNQYDSLEMYLAGPAMIVVDTIDYIKKDVQTFGSITFLIFFVLLILFFRDIWPAIIIMLNASLVILTTIGLLGIFDWPISIVSSNFLTLLFISSIAVSVHLLVKLSEGAKTKESKEQSLSKIFVPCAYTALTTMVGFASLLLSNIQPVIDFGKMMTLGVAINFIITFIFIPILISIKDQKHKTQIQLADLYLKKEYMPWKSVFKKIYMPVFIICLPLFLFLSTNLKVENKFIDYFDSETEIYKGMLFIDQDFGGTTPIDIILTLPEEEVFIDEDDLFFSEDSEVSEYWWKQKNMQILKDIQLHLNTWPELGKDLSVVNGVLLAESLNNNNSIGDLELAFVKNSLLTNDKAEDLLSSLITDDQRSVRITYRINDTYEGLNRNETLNEISSFLDNKLKDTDVDYKVSGLGVLYNNLLQSLFDSQIKTLSFVFISIFIMLLILFRSFFISLLVVIVPIFSVGAILSLMSLLSIPLDIMTITIASISVGMSVDYAIHIAWRFQYEKENNNPDPESAAILSSGQAVLITGLTIVIGFLVFVFSYFKPTILFGLFAALAIWIGMFLSLRLIPLILNTK